MPGTSRSLTSVALLAAAIVAGCLAGACNTKLEEPPLEITYRESLVGAGKILQVKNQSNLPLHEVEITIRSKSGEVEYKETELPGYEVLEVGWKKLGGYEIPAGATIEVTAQGFLLPVTAEIAAAASGDPASDSGRDS